MSYRKLTRAAMAGRGPGGQEWGDGEPLGPRAQVAPGAGVWSICRGLGATGLWDRGLGPGSALLPGGEPHVLEGWWEKEYI